MARGEDLRAAGFVASLVVSAILAYSVLYLPAADTTAIAAGALAIAVGLATLSFQYASLLDRPEDAGGRREAIRAGERLTTASVALVAATAVRAVAYFNLAELTPEWRTALGLFALGLFFLGAVNGCAGLVPLVAALYRRRGE